MSKGFTTANISPVYAPTQEELNLSYADAQKRSFGNTIGNLFSWQTIGDAQNLHSPVAMFIRKAQRDDFDVDPAWKLTSKKLDELVLGVDPKYWDMFADSVSADHAQMIRSQALDLTETSRRQSEAGWGGVLAGIGASIFDPTALAAGLLSGGASYAGVGAEIMVNAARAARIGRLVRAGFANAIPQAIIDAYAAEESPDMTLADVASGFAGSFAFGGFIANQAVRDATRLAAGQAIDSRKIVALSGALSQSVPSLVSDMVLSDKSATEMMGATAFNMLLGAGFSTAVRSSEMGKAIEGWARSTMRDVDNIALHQEGLKPDYVPPIVAQTTTEAIAGIDAKGGLPVVQPNVIKEILQAILAEQVTENPKRFDGTPMAPVGSPTQNAKYRPGLLDLSTVNDSELAMQDARMFGPLQQIHGEGTSPEKLIANMAGFDPIGKADPNSRNIAAATWADARARGESALLESTLESHRRAYNENARKSNQPELNVQQWSEIVGDAIVAAQDNPTLLDNIAADPRLPSYRFDSQPQNRPIIASKEVAASVKAVFEHNKKTLKVMEDMGVEGIPENDNWFPAMWDNPKMTAFRQQSGANERKIRIAFANSVEKMMERGNLETLFPTLEVQEKLQRRAQVAQMVADQIILNGGAQRDIDSAVQHSLVTTEQWNQLEKRIKEKFPDAGIGAIRELLFELKPIEGEDKAASFLKRRIPMDYSFRTRFEDGSTLAPSDFLNKDAIGVSRAYTRRAYGVAAASEMGRVAKETYNLSVQPRTLDDFMELARQSQVAANAIDEGRLYNLEHMLKQVFGLPLEYSVFGNGKNVKLYQSVLRGWRASIRAALLAGPNAMIGQAQEFAGITGSHGVGVLTKAIPWAMDLRKKLAEGGKIDSAIMKMAVEYGFVSGEMTDRIVRSHMVEDAQLEANGATWQERASRVIDKFATRANRASGLISGETFTRNIQEGAAFYAAADHLYKTAIGQHSPKIGDLELQQWGTTRSEYDHVISQVKKYATETNAGYHEVNLESWRDALGQIDLAGMAAYERIVVKDARLAVQMGESTLIPRSWFSTEGKIATQLMPYAYSSYFTRLLPAIRRKGDIRTASMLFHSMSAAALGMLALTYMQSIGREDREEFLAKRLEPGKFARNVVARSAFLTLIPRFADAFAAGAGYEAPFSGSRLSGLGQDGGFLGAIAGNPSIDRVQKIVGAARGVIRAPLDSGYDYSRRDLRNALGAIGMPNYLGVHNVIMQITDLPERPN